MKTTILILVFLVASTARAAELSSYFSGKQVEAYYDKASKSGNTVTVMWVHKKDAASEKFEVVYRFKAYCTTHQLFSISNTGAEKEVPVEPDTLYEATWQLICGIH